MSAAPACRTTVGPADPRSRLILGLGNPGADYRETRHNLGFMVVDELAGRLGIAVDRLECNTLVGRSGDLWLAKPMTYMNRSGYAAACLIDRMGLEPEAMVVVVDDVDLPLGTLRLRPGGSPGGHRGLESVVENLRTDRVPRLRLGVGGADPEERPPGTSIVDYVLEPFAEGERQAVGEMISRAADACLAWRDDGVESAMNRFNGQSRRD